MLTIYISTIFKKFFSRESDLSGTPFEQPVQTYFSKESDLGPTPFEKPEQLNNFTQKHAAEDDKTATSKLEINNGPTQCHEQQRSNNTAASALGLNKMFPNYNSANAYFKCTSNQEIVKYNDFSGLSRAVSEELTKGTEEHGTEVTKLGPPKTSATVQIFHSHYGNTIKAIEMDFETLLKNRLKKVYFEKCDTLEDIDPSKMLIVLTSRVGTDAAYAVKGIDRLNPANTILVLIHVKDSHALSKQASSTVLTDQPFRALGCIFDLAFVNGKGIYQCEMNDITLDGVCTFINKNL